MIDRKTADITFDSHVFTRQLERNFDLDFAEETVKTGVIVEEKSAPPNKLCIKKYHGKERQTYYVIAIVHAKFIEVKTVWLNKGR